MECLRELYLSCKVLGNKLPENVEMHFIDLEMTKAIDIMKPGQTIMAYATPQEAKSAIVIYNETKLFECSDPLEKAPARMYHKCFENLSKTLQNSNTQSHKTAPNGDVDLRACVVHSIYGTFKLLGPMKTCGTQEGPWNSG